MWQSATTPITLSLVVVFITLIEVLDPFNQDCRFGGSRQESA